MSASKKKDTTLVYTFRPSVLAILLHFKVFLITLLVPFYIVYSAGKPSLAIGIGVATGLAFGGKPAHYGLDMCFSKCSLYLNFLEYRTGWVKIQRRVLKYDNMVDVSYSQNVHDRLLHFGKILITTKGVDRTLEMKMIGAPYQRYKVIKKILNMARSNPALLAQFAREKGPINVIEN
tara:strand:- start:319 stop:849 length:531 start_codon:yes stop_codon:yes gene_type:complete